MSNMIRQTSFTAGEVDPINFKRTDLNAYLTAAQSLQNMRVTTTGAAKKRFASASQATIIAPITPTSSMFEFIDNLGMPYVIIIYAGNALIYQNGITLIQTLTSLPYTNDDIANIDYSLDNDVLVLTHPLYQTARIYVSNYATNPVTFAYQELNIYPQPAYDFGEINYNGFTVSASVTGNVLTFEFTGLLSDPGYTTAWIGGQIVGAGPSADSPIGYAIITNVVPYSGGTVTFTANVEAPFGSTFSTSGNQYSIRQPCFTAALGYPGIVLFYQNRLWLANTRTLPNTLFGSKINTPLSFDVGIGLDTDAIIYTLGQSNSGGIVSLNSGKQMEIYTSNFEFVCPQDQNSALTPSTFSIRQQSSYGSSTFCKPVSYLNDSYYIARNGKSIINFQFNGVGLSYTSTNVSLASQHLVKSPINRALVRGNVISQDNYIFYLNTDGSITCFQFAAEDGLAALTPLVFAQGVQVYDICSVNNEIFLLKHYPSSSTTTLEKFVPDDTTDTIVSPMMDGYITATMTNGAVSGLNNFNGYVVCAISSNAMSGAFNYGEATVSGGAVQFDTIASDSVYLGIIYDTKIIPMYLYAGQNEADYFKNISRIYVDYLDSLDFYVDNTFVNYQSFILPMPGGSMTYPPLLPQTGTAVVSSVNGWYNPINLDRSTTFSITQHSPFDLQIVSISYQIQSVIM